MLIFKPIFDELERRGIKYTVTARDYAQTAGLLELYGVEHHLIGRHGGRGKTGKIRNLLERSTQLKKFISDKNVTSAVSHGSRTQAVAAKRLGIKCLVLLDYEYTESRIFNWFADRILMPDIIPQKRLSEAGFNLKKVVRYSGLKEEIYIGGFKPDLKYREKINTAEDEILIVLRPPAFSSNYHDSKSSYLLDKILDTLSYIKNTKIIFLNRTEDETSEKFRCNSNIIFPKKPLDGLNLLYTADLAISGGGTMNREAALLGTKTYSFFTGRKPFVDEFLAEKGMLKFIECEKDIKDIEIERRRKDGFQPLKSRLSGVITDLIADFSKL